MWWEGHPVDQVVEGLRTYVEKGYAADGKAEKYVRGIIRNIGATSSPQPNESRVTYPSLRNLS